MDFDTGQRDNLGLYPKLFEEIQYIPQMDHYEGFSSSSSSHISPGRVFLNPNLDHHHHHHQDTSWNSGLFYAPNSSFYDPFDPFQPSFGQDDDNVSALNSHVLKTFLDEGGQDSRASFRTMDDHQYTMNVIEPLDYPRTTTMSGYSPSYNTKYFDKDSCFVFGDLDDDVDNDDDDAKRETDVDVKNKITQAKRKRVVDKKSEIVKGQWSPEEDGLLVELVEKHGVRKWSTIAQMLPGRIGKQCRERWHNHLKPNIKKDRWSEEEDKILIEAHRQLGNKWAEIARSLPGRSENTIKNHWNATKRRQLSSRKNKNSKTISPLQNYIKTVISTSDDKGNLDNSSSSSSASASPDGTANPKPVDNFSEMMKTEKVAVSAAAAEESFTLLPIISAMGTDHMHMHFDLQKEMDFMEMLSYNGYYI